MTHARSTTLVLLIGLAAATGAATRVGPWCGMAPCGEVPEVFAPGFVTTAAPESGGTFTPDGGTFVFTRRQGSDPDGDRLWWTRRIDDRWLAPEPAPFARSLTARDPHVSPDGSRLYYLVRAAEPAANDDHGDALWALDRQGRHWGGPHRIGAALAARPDARVSAAADGSLIATCDGELRWFELTGVGFEPPRRVPIATGTIVDVSDPHVTPDQGLLLLSARPGATADRDLYLCVRTAGGRWSPPQRLPDAINTSADEFAAWLSFDGRFLFFTRETAAGANIWWVSARILADLICGP